MGVTAVSGPFLQYGQTTTSTGGLTEYNEERGPSLCDLGDGILDPRPNLNWEPGNPVGSKVFGLWGTGGLVDAVPSSMNSSIGYIPGTIVSCLTGSSAATGAITLNTTVSSAVGVWLNQTILAPETGQNTTVTMAVDFATPSLTFGSAGTVNIWNPANGVARAVVVAGTTTSSADDSGASISVAGRDVYGFKMTETIPLSSLSRTVVAIGKKAFKYVNAISWVNSSLLNSTNINISFSDKFGFPTRVDTPMYVDIIQTTSASSASTYIFGNSSQGVTYAQLSSITATATTADVRGTWTASAVATFPPQSRLQITTMLNPVNLQAMSGTNAAGIFGVSQFSSV